MNTRVIGLLMMAMVLGCGRPDPAQEIYGAHSKLVAVTAKSPEVFPGEPVASPEMRKMLQHATDSHDAFPITQFVKLEVTEQSMIGQVSDLLFLEGYWFVLDRMQNQVFRFSEDGQFSGLIGRAGQGPGEYIGACNIVQVFGDKLGVLDDARGRVLVYDLDGTLLRVTPELGTPGGGMYPTVATFIWERPERFYLADFTTSSSTVPQHVAIDYQTEQGVPLFGFGHRYERFERWARARKVPFAQYQHFRMIGGRIWAANPYIPRIEVYDVEGRTLDHLWAPHPENQVFEDYDDFEPSFENWQRMGFKKFNTVNLFQAGDIVAQAVSRGRFHLINLFDVDGALLRAGLPLTTITSDLKASKGKCLVSVMPILDRPEWYQEITDEREFELLKAAGWDSKKYLEDNDYLVISCPSCEPVL